MEVLSSGHYSFQKQATAKFNLNIYASPYNVILGVLQAFSFLFCYTVWLWWFGESLQFLYALFMPIVEFIGRMNESFCPANQKKLEEGIGENP